MMENKRKGEIQRPEGAMERSKRSSREGRSSVESTSMMMVMMRKPQISNAKGGETYTT